MRYKMTLAALFLSLTDMSVALTAQKPAFEVASIKPKGPMKVYYIVFCVLTLLLMQIAVAQQPSAANVITFLQEELGLRLESTKVAVDVIVIDHAEKPDPN